MKNIKIIKTKDDYRSALALIEELMVGDPNPDSEQGEQLDILTTLVKDYETKNFSDSLPSPIEAIKFRMDQMDMKPADLVPFIGSRSRVSEILSGKRKLTLEMIRSLEAGFGIPAKVLIKEPVESTYQNWSNALLKEMDSRGYFGKSTLSSTNGDVLLQSFFSRVGSPTQFQGMLRQSNYRTDPKTDRRALVAWAARVVEKATSIKVDRSFKQGDVNLDFMQELVKLSKEPKSPLLAQEALLKKGIVLVIEPHFPKTRLDGAALLIKKSNPIIGLTLRYDRLDNFWFTLMHELAHIVLHYNAEASNLFYDELNDVKGLEVETQEREADELASEALVPTNKWDMSPAKLIPSSLAATSLAKELGVHVAIVAGKIRHEGGKYVYLNRLVENEKVRHYFLN